MLYFKIDGIAPNISALDAQVAPLHKCLKMSLVLKAKKHKYQQSASKKAVFEILDYMTRRSDDSRNASFQKDEHWA